MSATSPERAAFEAWCDVKWSNCAYLHKSMTCGEWAAWQAARRQALEDAAQACDAEAGDCDAHNSLVAAVLRCQAAAIRALK